MLEQIDVTEAKEALLTIHRRVEQYAWLLHALETRDISEDRHFRRAWLNHFKLRDKDREFCRYCFRWLEEHKGRRVSFEQALLDLYHRFGILDPASASKLAATIDPALPVWDPQILGSLGIRPWALEKSGRRIEKTLEAYDKLEGWYTRYLNSRDGRMAVQVFDEIYPGTGFSAAARGSGRAHSALTPEKRPRKYPFVCSDGRPATTALTEPSGVGLGNENLAA